MKSFLILAVLIVFSTLLYGQKKETIKDNEDTRFCAGVKTTKQFKVGDTLITCNTCRWDQCGNVIDKNSDTLYKNNGVVHPDFHPVFLTIDSILLTKSQVLSLLRLNKVRNLQFLHCNEVAKSMGFIALEGLYLIELRDTLIQWQPLLSSVRTKVKDTSILSAQILVNGYNIKSDNLRYPIANEIEVAYVKKSNLYCVLTE